MAPTVRKFSAQGSDLHFAGKWVEKATSKDNSEFAITVEKGILTIEAFNGIHSSVAKVSVDQSFDGETHFSLPSKMMMDPLKNMSSQTVKFEFSERKLIMSAPKMRYVLPVRVPRSAVALPELPKLMGVVNVKNFTTILGHCTSMSSDDPSAPSLTTVHFEVEPQNKLIKLMTTDRYRMAIRTVSYLPDSDASQENFTFDVDSRALKELVAGLGDADELKLYAEDGGDKLFGVGTNMMRASVLLKDVQAINYSAFEKLNTSNSIIVRRKEMISVINMTKSAASGGTKTGSIVLNGDDLSITSGGVNGSVDTEMEVEAVSHDFDENIDIHCNLDYVGSVLKAGSSEFVKFGINSNVKPILVYEMKDKDTIDTDYFSLFMPLKK